MRKYLVILLFATASCAFGQPLHVVSPSGVIGNPGGGGAFLVDTTVAPSARSQQVYGASDFLSVSSPILITELRFSGVGSLADFDFDLQNIRIDLSTTARMPDGLSATFADNVGTDHVTVYSGQLHFSDTGIERFGIHIPLQTAFLFDPSRGNLLLDVRNFVTAPPPGLGVRQLFGENTVGDTISSTLSYDVNSETARFVYTGGMLTWFEVTPVPEPSTVVLLIFGGAALVVTIERRKRSAFGRNDSPRPQPTPKKD